MKTLRTSIVLPTWKTSRHYVITISQCHLKTPDDFTHETLYPFTPKRNLTGAKPWGRTAQLPRPVVRDKEAWPPWPWINIGLGSSANRRERAMVRRGGSRCQEEAPGKVGNSSFESRCNENDDISARGVKTAVKELVANRMVTMVGGALDAFLGKAFHNTQSLVQSIVYNVLQQKCWSCSAKTSLRRR